MTTDAQLEDLDETIEAAFDAVQAFIKKVAARGISRADAIQILKDGCDVASADLNNADIANID